MAANKQMEDPGFGTQYSGRYKRIVNDDGSFNVIRKGVGPSFSDAYHFLINCGWPAFLGLVVGIYFLFNGLFALVYLAFGMENISGTTAGGFGHEYLQAFYFSVQTFTTVGYGAMAPEGPVVSMVAAIEAMTGLLGFALATGLLYGRFSKPNARFLFSRNAIVSPYRGINALMFRVVNKRSNIIMNMNATVLLVLTDRQATPTSSVGSRRYYQLPLERSSIFFFPLTWTVVHPIDEDSPLHGMSEKDLERQDAELMILLQGYDENFAQLVHRRYSYTSDEIVVGAKFVRAFHRDDEGNEVVDVHQVHTWTPVSLNP